MRDDVEGTWPENKDEDSRWKMAKRRARRSQKAKWRTSRMTTMAKNLEDEIEASAYLVVSVLRPALSGVGQVQVDVAAVAVETPAPRTRRGSRDGRLPSAASRSERNEGVGRGRGE